MEARERRSVASAPAVAADENMIRLGLGDPGRDRPDSHLAHQFHAETRAAGLDVLQVVNELRQVLDGINVMMRRRRNKPDAGRTVADKWRCTHRPC